MHLNKILKIKNESQTNGRYLIIHITDKGILGIKEKKEGRKKGRKEGGEKRTEERKKERKSNKKNVIIRYELAQEETIITNKNMELLEII